MNAKVRRLTGRQMLETLDRIFLELDEMGRPMVEAVSCPHGDRPRPQFDTTLTYMGRTLDFCVGCHGLIVEEFKRMNANLMPKDYRLKARTFMADCLSGPVGDRWPRLDPDLCPDLDLLKQKLPPRR